MPVKQILKLKETLPYFDDRGALEGKEVETIERTKGGFRFRVKYNDNTYWITAQDIDEKIERLDKGKRPFNGEFAATIERISNVNSPSADLIEAVKILRSMEKALDYVVNKKLISMRRLAKIMNCCVKDIAGGI